jgi:hypothetical protein
MTTEVLNEYDEEFFNASNSDPEDESSARFAIAVLASQTAVWRSEAMYYRGRCEGQAETIEYLRARVELLEKREWNLEAKPS